MSSYRSWRSPREQEAEWTTCSLCKDEVENNDPAFSHWLNYGSEDEPDWTCPQCEHQWSYYHRLASNAPKCGLGELKLAIATMEHDRSKLRGRVSADAWIRSSVGIHVNAMAYIRAGGDVRELVIAWAEHGPAGIPIDQGPLWAAVAEGKARKPGKRVIETKESA